MGHPRLPGTISSRPPRPLTPRELKTIALVTDGFTNAAIGERLGTSEHVVKNYLRIIYDKLGLWNRVELALWYVAHYG